MKPLSMYALVFLGAGLGGALRHGINVFAARHFGPDVPVGTLLISVAGSFAMGAIAGYAAFKGSMTPEARIFATTGFLGGFTTFSAFSLETVLLFERAQITGAIAYAAGSVVLSVAGVFAGLAIMRG